MAGTLFAYAVSLGFMWTAHSWIIDAHGHPAITDFLAIWSAGSLARNGLAPTTYDPHLLHLSEVTAAGHEFRGFLSWYYPPAFLFVAAGLACVGYAWAFVVWGFATVAGYATVIGAITKSRAAILLALAAPWTLAGLIIGQNGFLTASLIGFALLTLEGRPIVSGILLGLLTYKPQFGLLLPLALAVGGRWRVIAWAAATAISINVLSALFFGLETFSAMARSMPLATQTLLGEGAVGWGKLQSVYGLARWLGLSSAAGWTAHATVVTLCITMLAWLWSGSRSQSLKSAGLAAAALIATPYTYIHDFPVLAVAIGFLYRDGTFDRLESATLGFVLVCVIAFAATGAPCGVFAAIAIASFVLRRALATPVNGALPAERGDKLKMAISIKLQGSA